MISSKPSADHSVLNSRGRPGLSPGMYLPRMSFNGYQGVQLYDKLRTPDARNTAAVLAREFLQSLLGPGSWHCYAIISLKMPPGFSVKSPDYHNRSY
jgi:hypothetical protein